MRPLLVFPDCTVLALGCGSWDADWFCDLADDEGNEMTRPLGLVVVRGTLLVVLSPVDGSEVIANPFLQAEEE